MKKIKKFAIENIKNRQQKQIKNVNKHRKNIKYEVKNLIWVSLKNIITNWFSKKLNHKMINSYSIIKISNSSYQIKLFELTKIFDTFYFDFLRKVSENSLSD